MSTIVVQSFRPAAPAWIRRCLDSVRAWAEGAGFRYRYAGDELFERVPADLRAQTADRPMVASDLARLAWLEELLAEGWDTAVWLDADVLVVDPARLTAALEPDAGYLLGREAWVQPAGRGHRLKAVRGVHNALLAVRRGNPFLAFYREAAGRILARHDGPMVPQLIGPKFLGALDNMMGLPATWAVNMASPLVLRDAAAGGGPALDLLLTRSAAAPAALNLCQSYVGREADGVTVDETLVMTAIERLTAAKSMLTHPHGCHVVDTG